MTDDTEVQYLVAVDIRELKKALQKAIPDGTWYVEQKEHGHADLRCYDAFGNLHTVIRNRK